MFSILTALRSEMQEYKWPPLSLRCTKLFHAKQGLVTAKPWKINFGSARLFKAAHQK